MQGKTIEQIYNSKRLLGILRELNKWKKNGKTSSLYTFMLDDPITMYEALLEIKIDRVQTDDSFYLIKFNERRTNSSNNLRPV